MSAAAAGRAGRLGAALASYLRIGWWGLVAPRLQERRPLVVVQGVVWDGERLLLALRDDLWGWELPGGTQEEGERPEETLRREIAEETGLVVEVGPCTGLYRRRGFRPHTARIHLCRVVGGSEGPGDEVLALCWARAEALPRDLFPWYREPIAHALAAVPLDAGDPAPRRRDEWQGLRAILQAMGIDLRMRWRGVPRDPGA